MSFHRSYLCLLWIAGAFAPADVLSDQPSPNAALVHWQAFALLPATEKDQDQVLKQAATVPLDDAVSNLTQQSEASIECLQRAATIANCDWGLDYSAGPHLMMPHLSKSRQMGHFAVLRARKDFADGKADAAVGVIGDTFVLARHAGDGNVLISVLVQFAIESECFEAAARQLPNLNSKQLDALSQRLDSLPPGGSLLEALKVEKEIYVGWARRIVRESRNDAEAVRSLMTIASDLDEPDPAVTQITREQINEWLDGTSRDYDEVFALYDLPHAEFEARWKALQERLEDGNPYSRMVLPGLKGIRDVRDRNTASWALFRGALAVVRNGVASVDAQKDPFGNGPLRYTKLDGGFRLTSQFKFRDEPVSLTVGCVEHE